MREKYFNRGRRIRSVGVSVRACLAIAILSFTPGSPALAEHGACDPVGLPMASCGRIARGKTYLCNDANSDMVLDQCFINTFSIGGEDKRIIVYYTTTDLICSNVQICDTGANVDKACSDDGDCPDGKCRAVACSSATDCRTCLFGALAGEVCTVDADCGGGSPCQTPVASTCAPSVNAVPTTDTDADGTPDSVENIARWGEEAWRSFVAFGFHDPNRRTGSDGVKEMEVMLMGGGGWCCEAADDAHGGGIHLRASDSFPGRELTQEDTLIHEMFHVTQAHSPLGLVEASAQTMMDHTDATIDTWGGGSYLGQVKAFLGGPQESLLTWHYRHALWFTYFMEKFGTVTTEPQRGVDALVDYYNSGESNLITGLDMVIRAATADAETLETAWHDFGVANYVKNFDEPLPAKYRYFDETQAPGPYDWSRVASDPPVNPDLDLNLPVDGGVLQLTTLNAWSNHYYRIRPGSLPVISIDYQQDTGFTLAFSLLLIRGNVLVDQQQETGRSFVRSIANNSYDEVVLVVSAFANSANVRFAINPPLAILDIIDPVLGRAVRVGDQASPDTFLLKVELLGGGGGVLPVDGIDGGTFEVLVGSQTASLIHPESWSYIQGQYWLLMQAPPQSLPGLYNLTVNWGGLSETELQAIDYNPRADADHLLVIDRSGSMLSFNKMEAAQSAARLYVDSWRVGDKIGTVSFAGNIDPTLDMPLTDWSTGSRDATFTKINGLTAWGSTAIGRALLAGLRDEFDERGDTSHTWDVIVLSDGRENRTPDITEFLSIYAERMRAGTKNPVVHAIAIGPDANRPKLQELTTATGGLFLFAAEPTSAPLGGRGAGLLAVDLPNDLAERYRLIAETITREQQIFAERGTWNACAQDINHAIPLESGATSAVFTLHWRRDFSGSGTPVPVLRRPDGVSLFPDLSNDTHAVFRVTLPQPGIWNFGWTIDGFEFCGGSYVVEAAITSDLRLNLYFPSPLADRAVGLEQPILVALNSSAPVVDATVTATIIIPKFVGALTILPSAIATLELFDDGRHNDGRAGDGFYGNLFRGVRRSGAFTVIVNATGTTALTGAFRRRAMGSFDIAPDADTDGDGMTDRWEMRHGLDPASNDGGLDPDADGLTNLDEYLRGTDPNDSDTDDGGESDGSEVAYGRDPLEPDDDLVGPVAAFYLPRLSAHDIDDLSPQAQHPFGIRLAFEAGEKQTQLFLARSTQPDSGYTLLGGNTPLPLFGEFLDTGVDVGTTYYYKMIGVNDAGHLSAVAGPLRATGRVDSIDPDGSVLINDGALQAPSRDVALTLSASDDVTEMRVANSYLGTTAWEPFVSSKPWTLADAIGLDGVLTVVAEFRDASGNVSSLVTASIRLASAVGDCNGDRIVDVANDFALFLGCMAGPGHGPLSIACVCADCDHDNDVDLADYRCFADNVRFPQCGDAICSVDEQCDTCAQDCGICEPVCGDAVCESPETCASCPADCGSCEGTCCVANNTIGCGDDAVTACVCAYDISCCTQVWGQQCADIADHCGSCGGDCCRANGSPGCDDSQLEQCVCQTDASCCLDSWHAGCADLAIQQCNGCPTFCGDGFCDARESVQGCPVDCDLGPLCADLTPLSFSGPQQASPGDDLTQFVQAAVRNIGTADAGSFFVGFYLSVDPIITTSDTLLIGGRESIAGLSAGAQTAVNTSMTIPAQFSPGNVYLGMLVDEFDEVESECKEDNNAIAIPITILAPD